jgi:hypothetical protein
MFHLVPRGLLKGTESEIPSTTQGSPGAQPEIASKAVREGIEDRLHDPIVRSGLTIGNGSRSLGTLFFSARLPLFIQRKAPYVASSDDRGQG